LNRNLIRNDVASRVVSYRAVAADQLGDARINVVVGREEYSSLASVSHPSALTARTRTETVSSVTIDSLCNALGLSPGFIKLDIEGAELLALKGAEATLRNCRPMVLMEASDLLMSRFGTSTQELIAFLTRLDYSVIDLDFPDCPINARFMGELFAVPCEAVTAPSNKARVFIRALRPISWKRPKSR
jgi:FkbM family methyltransferase